jgi:predicted MPP superfamily phosphohydrolase
MFFVVSWVLTMTLFWVVYRWAVDCFPALARRKAYVIASLAGLWLGQPLVRWFVVGWHVGGVLHSVLLLLSMTVAIAGIAIGLMRAASWAVARCMRPVPGGSVPAGAVEGPAMSRRQIVEASGGAALFGATGSMLAWGAVRGRHAFELCELPVRIPGLPRALDGYVIAQISDIHTGTYVGERELEEGLARVREAHPDLLVVTGDIVDFDERYAPLIARKLGDASPRDGVTAILGNHDYYAGADTVTDALRKAGVDVLVDAGKVVRPADGGGFALLGVDDLRAAKHGRPGPRLDRALAMVPPELPRILLSHQPPTADLWAGRVALQLSGHTHGGQINPGFRPADLLLKYVAGRYAVGQTTLYVNRGFGTVGPPSRVGAAPEVTRIVLVAA